MLLAVASGWFLILGVRFVLPGILPTITESYDASASQAGFAMTVLWGTYALMQFPAGYYVDRINERILLTIALIIGGVGLASYLITPTFALFILATGLFGFGTGLYGTPRGTIVSKTFSNNDSTAFGIILAAGSLGAAILPALAAVAVILIGWRITLLLISPAFVVGAIGVWLAVPVEPRRAPSEQTIIDGIWRSAGVFLDKRVSLAVAGITLMLFVFQAATAFLTIYLVDVKGISQGTAGTLLGGLFVVGTISQWYCGWLADRVGTPRVLLVVSLLSIVPLLVLPIVNDVVLIVIASVAIGIRMSIGPLSNAYIIDLIPDAIKGRTWGAIRSGFFIVSSIGSTLVGYMADSDMFDTAFYLLAGLTAVGAIIYGFLPERS